MIVYENFHFQFTIIFFLTSEILASSQSLLVFKRFEGKNFYHKQKILSGF